MPRSTASGGKCVARYISPTNKLGKSLNCQEGILQRILSGVSLVLVSIFGRIYKIPRLLDGTHFRCEVLQITEGRKVIKFLPPLGRFPAHLSILPTDCVTARSPPSLLLTDPSLAQSVRLSLSPKLESKTWLTCQTINVVSAS